MRIANSSVDLASERLYSSRSQMTMAKSVALYGGQNQETPSFTDALKKSEQSDCGEELFTNYNAKGEFALQVDSTANPRVSEIENIRMQIMEKILNLMQLIYGEGRSDRGNKMKNFMRELSGNMYSGGYQWMSVSSTRYIHIEEEQTAFTARGLARTEDGREIGFDVNLTMTRKFAEEISATHMQPIELIDPLVINIGDGVTEISDQTFTFDLDADGKEEEIKSLGQGAGFLAYDKNGDGIINDGSELFGAKTGDGFGELQKYDSDGDGWIDEDDEIFDKLKVWCRGEDGKDTLMTLKEADVGAIYLGKAETDFTSQGNDFAVNGRYRFSSVFLRESTGKAGMIHQLDLAKANKTEQVV